MTQKIQVSLLVQDSGFFIVAYINLLNKILKFIVFVFYKREKLLVKQNNLK